jgi:hypothetical protein
MERDEEGTLRLLKATQRDLIEPRVRDHHGRIVKTTGEIVPWPSQPQRTGYRLTLWCLPGGIDRHDLHQGIGCH